jgi:hypothetical protein
MKLRRITAEDRGLRERGAKASDASMRPQSLTAEDVRPFAAVVEHHPASMRCGSSPRKTLRAVIHAVVGGLTSMRPRLSPRKTLAQAYMSELGKPASMRRGVSPRKIAYCRSCRHHRRRFNETAALHRGGHSGSSRNPVRLRWLQWGAAFTAEDEGNHPPRSPGQNRFNEAAAFRCGGRCG